MKIYDDNNMLTKDHHGNFFNINCVLYTIFQIWLYTLSNKCSKTIHIRGKQIFTPAKKLQASSILKIMFRYINKSN